MAMDSRPFLVLADTVSDFGFLSDDQQEQWGKVEVRRKEVYGCGAIGKHILHGVVLLTNLGAGADDDPDLHPSLAIDVAEDVFSLVGAEIDDEAADLYGRSISLSCRVYVVVGDIMVIDLSFVASHESCAFRSFYLVYDSAARSLTLLPTLPQAFPAVCTTASRPLPLRRQDGEYSMILTAYRQKPTTLPRRLDIPVFCVWSRPPSGEDAPWLQPPPPPKSGGRGPPGIKHPVGVRGDDFNVNWVFVCKDRAVWCDFGQGIQYCKCSPLVNGQGPLGYTDLLLPKEFRIPPDVEIMMDEPIHVHRTVGCVGDSIWFVDIQQPSQEGCVGDTKVEVWTVDILSDEKRNEWKKHREFRLRSIWELDGFNDKLPKTAPRFPFLRQQDVGILYLILPNNPGIGAHLVGIDLRSKSSGMHLVSCRRLAMPSVHRPIVLPPDFFGTDILA